MNPIAITGGILVTIAALATLFVVIAYFSQRRSRIVEVPAVTVWRKIGRPLDSRSFSSWFQSLASLLAQLIIIVIAAIAIERSLHFGRSIAHRLAIIIDVGNTMNSREPGGRSRLDIATELATERLRQSPSDCLVTIILAAHRPLQLTSGAVDVSTAIAQLDHLRSFDVESDLIAAVRSAAFLQRDPSAATVLVSDFVDRSPTELQAIWKGPAGLEFVHVGSDQANVAIVGFSVEPSLDGSSWNVHAAIRSRGLTSHPAAIRLRDANQLDQSKTVSLDDGKTVPIDFDNVECDAGSTIQLSIVSNGDSLSSDDQAFAVIPHAKQQVCLVTRGNPSIENALHASRNATVRVTNAEQFQNDVADRVVIFDREIPIGQRLVQQDGTSYLMIHTVDPFGIAVIDGDDIPVKRATQWIANHPALKDLQPDLFFFRKAMAIRSTGDPFIPVLSAENSPLIVQTRSRLAFWLFDPSDTDLPSRAAFPMLLWNTIDSITADRSKCLAEFAYATGADIPIGRKDEILKVHDPSGSPVKIRAIGDEAIVEDVVTQGAFEVDEADGQHNTFAANCISDRGLRSVGAFNLDPSRSILGNGERAPISRQGADSWRSLICIAIALASVEWLFFQRRWIRVG